MTLNGDEVSELACTYAALILHDADVPINGDNLKKVLDAAGVKAAPFWTGLFARVLATKNIEDFLSTGGGAAPAPAAAAPAPEAAAPKEEKGGKSKKEEKEEKKAESDEDMGFGLFD